MEFWVEIVYQGKWVEIMSFDNQTEAIKMSEKVAKKDNVRTRVVAKK